MAGQAENYQASPPVYDAQRASRPRGGGDGDGGLRSLNE